MPHLYLEYSDNILDKPEHGTLLRQLHAALVGCGPYKMEDIKSRLTIHEKFVVADGEKDQAFVHLQVAIMPRDPQVMKDTSEKLLAFLTEKFPKTKKDANSSFSVEIRLLEKDYYSKSVFGTL